MTRVYVIEDDVSLRDILVQSLQQALSVEAYGFGQVDEALESWASYPPDMVLSELNLPGRSGLDLAAELEACGWHGPLVFFSEALEEFSPHIPHLPRVALLAKPFDLHALLTYVYEELSQPDPVEPGLAAPFGLFDYVQLSCVGGHTVEINVFSDPEETELVGRVVILGGELWSAQDAQGMGSDAFLRLACLPNARVTCNALLHTSVARNIPCSWDALMLRAATLVDDVHERMVRGFDGDTPVDAFGQAGPIERPTYAGPPPGHPGHPVPPQQEEPVDFGQHWAQPSPEGEVTLGAEGYVHMDQAALPSHPEPTPSAPAPEPVAMGLHDLVQAANAAEDAGRPADALAYLEQAVVRFPGHPEILLGVLRLKKQNPN